MVPQREIMTDTLLELAYTLTKTVEPFVLATVVWCERPTSAKPGARAIIQADGTITGWIGGSCAQPVVIREAQRIMREGDVAYACISHELRQWRLAGYLYGTTYTFTSTGPDRRFAGNQRPEKSGGSRWFLGDTAYIPRPQPVVHR